MTEDQQEQLVRRFPDLFQKSGDFEMSAGEGWFNIIYMLCRFMSHDVEQARQRLKYSMENPTAKFVKPIPEIEKDLADALEALPTITQVKEKFGSLRFYIDGGSAEINNYIEFAEAMSSVTCEVCGSPGKSRNDGWIKVLCDPHNKEKEEKESFISATGLSLRPKLFED